MDKAVRPDSINKVLDNLRARSHDELHKGRLFERLIVQYLRTDPTYANALAHVWTWAEWPQRPATWKADNTGIDLVAQTNEGTFWAIQCKFYDAGATLDKAHVSSFLADSTKVFTVDGVEQSFAYRLFVSTTARLGKGAEDVISDQPDFGILYREDLAEAPVDWPALDVLQPEQMQRRARKQLRDHQEEAIAGTVEGFAGQDRGKLIMACGTGKTFTALRMNERVTPETGLTLFLAPSITLVSQTLREWSAEAEQPFDAFVVCSDTRVGREEEDIKTAELAYPATTDSARLAHAIVQSGKKQPRRRIIFSTYQSIQVVIDAQRVGRLPAFDLVICDEAHRTTGLTLPGEDASDFVKIHDNAVLRAGRRVYMTATPRIYADASKTRAGEKNAVLYSMDDETTFGPEFYRLSFGQAVQRDLLAEYRVLIVAVDEDRMASVASSFNSAYRIDEKKAVDIGFATRIIGSWKGLSKQGLKVIEEDGVSDLVEDTAPMRRAVAFSRSIKASQEATEVFADLVRLYRDEHEDGGSMVNAALHHVDGGMNMARRKDALDWLKDEPGEGQCRILSNARCLSEGVDVPALDAVVFFDTRESIVDIVQSVGRVMRKAPGKQYGYIILPVAIPTARIADYNSYLESDPQFRGIWKVIKALRAHDERLVDEAEFRRRIRVIGRGSARGDSRSGGGEQFDQLSMDFPMVPVEDIQQAVYAVLPKKLGDREYWAEWARSVAEIARRITLRIEDLIERPYGNGRKAFNAYLSGLRRNINPGISEDEAVEMLAQHIITRPVFDALFEGRGFSQDNPISQAMQRIIGHVDDHGVDSETDDLERFYKNVRDRVALARSDRSRQEIIKNLYDTFFNNAFPRMAERLGIVYTPIEPVDFIVHSIEAVLNRHFNSSVSSPDVQIIDPFVGTGTFIVRLLQSGLIRSEDLERKYRSELHANEIVLLAYYVAAVNIETAYHGITGKNAPFGGIVLTDTFQMYEQEQGDHLEGGFSRENTERVDRQKKQPIRVVMANPPYSVGQTNANDNNQNQKYPMLDERVRVTYAARSSATLKNSLYASEIKAMRWASDRIGEEGVVAFVTNSAFIDKNTADGLRRSLAQEFSHIYALDLRGSIRGRSGDEAKREGQSIFNIMTGTALLVLVKNPTHTGPCEILYRNIGDYLDREEKLGIIADFGSIENVPWTRITPNEAGDWINQRNPEFEGFVALGDKDDRDALTVFGTYSGGVKTNRDDWAYNFSRADLESNMRRMIDNYNIEVDRYAAACKTSRKKLEVESVVDNNPSRIKWSSKLVADAGRNKRFSYNPDCVVPSVYRPFSMQRLYFSSDLNDRPGRMFRFFPTPRHQNLAISVTGAGERVGFSCLIVDCVPNLHLIVGGQCFPLYVYEKADCSGQPQADILSDAHSDEADSDGYVRRDAITDEALTAYRSHYSDDSITKEDLFYHVYGLLHSPEYREQYASDLKRMLPRIPRPASLEDFRAFSRAGRALTDLHLNYETIEPWPLEERYRPKQSGLLDTPEQRDYRVVKMRFPSKKDKTKIIYNGELTLEGIPPEAFEYVVNGKSAIEWVMERYQVTMAKDSGIVNDPNLWCAEHDDPRYIVDLVGRVVRVSVETVRIVRGLPKFTL